MTQESEGFILLPEQILKSPLKARGWNALSE
jgi:hypothetical protein